MGTVAVTLRILPAEVDTDFKKLETTISKHVPGKVKYKKCIIQPFAFGLKAMIAQFEMGDEEGVYDQLEEALRGIPEVQGVELLEMGRLM